MSSDDAVEHPFPHDVGGEDDGDHHTFDFEGIGEEGSYYGLLNDIDGHSVPSVARLPSPDHEGGFDDENDTGNAPEMESENFKTTGLEEAEHDQPKEDESDGNGDSEQPQYQTLSIKEQIVIAICIVHFLKMHEYYVKNQQNSREDFLELFRLSVLKGHSILLPKVHPFELLDNIPTTDSVQEIDSKMDAQSNIPKEDRAAVETNEIREGRYMCSICKQPKRNHICPYTSAHAVPDPEKQTLAESQEGSDDKTTLKQNQKYVRMFSAWCQTVGEEDNREGDSEVSRSNPMTNVLMPPTETRIPGEIFHGIPPGDKLKGISHKTLELIQREDIIPNISDDSDLKHQEETELGVSKKGIEAIKQSEKEDAKKSKKDAQIAAILLQIKGTSHVASSEREPTGEIEVRVPEETRTSDRRHGEAMQHEINPNQSAALALPANDDAPTEPSNDLILSSASFDTVNFNEMLLDTLNDETKEKESDDTIAEVKNHKKG